MLTVTPRLVLLIGLSPRRPLTGFKKHHAGITPSSVFCPGSGDLNRDLAVWTKVEFSLPTTHHPSSNDCTTVRRSPSDARSSSGRTGSNVCRTLRVVPDVLLIVEVPDSTENRLWLFVLIKEELWDCLDPTKFKSGIGGPADMAKGADARVNGLGNPRDWGTAGCIRAFSGRTTVELIICLENPLFDGRVSFSFPEPS